MVAMKPIMLKDFLELDENAHSCNGPAATAATVRCLLEAELVHRSKGALAKISNAISNVVNSLSLSKKVAAGARRRRGSFWKKSAKKEGQAVADKVRVKDIVRSSSFETYGLYFPDPQYFDSSCSSSCSSSSSCRHSSSSCSGLLLSSSSSFGCPEYLGEAAGRQIASSHSPTPTPTTKIAGVADAALLSSHHQETKEIMKNKELECCDYQREEEKEQLSPVSVMNFPFQEEEGNDGDEEESENENELCFEQNLANIERTRHKLLQNIRRFESLAALDPVDFAESFTNFEDHDEKDMTESGLIARLRSVGPHKKLLSDFFDEERTWTNDVEELLISAQNWILDEGHLTDYDYGKVQIGDMERNGRWRCFEGQKEDLAADMGVQILGSLVEDLVLDLLS